MIAKIQKEFQFMSGIYLHELFYLNYFYLDLFIDIESIDQKEQNVAIERVNYFLYNHVENAVFINQDEKKIIDNYEKAGLNVLTLPEDPYDQIIGLVLIRKLNAIMEDKLSITNIIISSRLSSEIKFHLDEEETIDYKGNFWWNDPKPITKKEKNKNSCDKVVKLFDDSWSNIGLVWEDRKID